MGIDRIPARQGDRRAAADAIGEIVAGTRAVTVDTGLRLSRFFGTSEGFWTGLQLDYDAATAKNALAKELAQIKPWATAA